MRRPAVQRHVDLVAVDDGIAGFGKSRCERAIAVLDLFAAEASLANADEPKQAELLAGRPQFLNAQTAPFQVLVRAEPVDLDGHLRRVQAHATILAQPLAEVCRDYVGLFSTLAQQRTLLERHCYVVIPDPVEQGGSVAERIRAFFRRLLLRSSRGRTETEGVSSDLNRRLLARCDVMVRQLGRSGLRASRLGSQPLSELLHRCWSPDQARVQRLRQELASYTALVVGSRQPASGGGTPMPKETVQRTDVAVSNHALETFGSEAARLFALGTRTLADLIAPSSYEITADHLRLDGQYARALAITAYPRLVTPGWLSVVAESDLPIELSMHVRPLDSADMVHELSLQVARLQSSRLAQLRGERIADPERDIALEDAERLRERLQRGEERVFSVSLYLLLRARSRHELDALTRRVEHQLDALLAHSRRALWEQDRGFASCRPEANDALLVPRNMNTSALAATLPFVGPSLAMESGMLYGLASQTQSPVILDPFDRSLDNANLVVVAPAGAGKSFSCKLLALRQLINGTDSIIVDPEDEYGPIANAVGGQVIRLAASSPHRLNPFDLPEPVEANVYRQPDLAGDSDPLAERITGLLGLLEVILCSVSGAGSRFLEAHERAVLDRALYRTYARAGITADPATHRRPAPHLANLYETLIGEAGEVAASLAVRLERFVSGSLGTGLFAGPTNVSMDTSFVVFQIRDLAEELRALAIHVIAGWVWNRVRRERRPRLLVIDEAWSLLRYAEGGAFLAAMARRARKYYLGLVTITQKVGDLSDGGHGDTILANSSMVLLLKQKAETIDTAGARFQLTSDERQFLLGADRGEGLLLVRGNRIPLQVVASRAEYRLATTNPRDLEELAARAQTLEPVGARSANGSPHEQAGNNHRSIEAALAARRARRNGNDA